MTTTTATDSGGGIQYYFDETSGNSGATDSDWQSSNSYTDSGLINGTTYTYRVQTRDAKGNVGSWSTIQSATPPAATTIPIAVYSLLSTYPVYTSLPTYSSTSPDIIRLSWADGSYSIYTKVAQLGAYVRTYFSVPNCTGSCPNPIVVNGILYSYSSGKYVPM